MEGKSRQGRQTEEKMCALFSKLPEAANPRKDKQQKIELGRMELRAQEPGGLQAGSSVLRN